jgi:hypothetical protein
VLSKPLLWSVSLLVLSGCPPTDVSCTEMGCTDGFEVSFSPAFRTAGTYELHLVLPDEFIECRIELPLSDELGQGCDTEGVAVATSGSALDESEHELTGFWLEAQPDDIDEIVRRDGENIATGDFQPDYATLQPNGPSCEPTCRFAVDEMTVDAP